MTSHLMLYNYICTNAELLSLSFSLSFASPLSLSLHPLPPLSPTPSLCLSLSPLLPLSLSFSSSLSLSLSLSFVFSLSLSLHPVPPLSPTPCISTFPLLLILSVPLPLCHPYLSLCHSPSSPLSFSLLAILSLSFSHYLSLFLLPLLLLPLLFSNHPRLPSLSLSPSLSL